jgi:acyl-CoA hydrolase
MALTNKRDLGSTEMFTDAIVDLVESGVVTGAARAQLGQVVTSFLMGSPRLYAFVPTTRWSRCGRSASPTAHVIRSFSRMVSINSIEVDLTGKVVADSIGHRMYSGVGGRWTSCGGGTGDQAVRSSRCHRNRFRRDDLLDVDARARA